MGDRADELKGRIEATRQDLGETLEEIGGRVGPEAAVSHVAASGFERFRQWAQAEPVRAALTLFGAGLVLGRLTKRS